MAKILGQKEAGIIRFNIVDKIGVLTINNGNQNKISKPDFLDMTLLKEWLSKEELKGIIITGQGRHFSSGADVDNIKLFKEDPNSLGQALKKGKELLSYIESLPIITVAAISGACFGAGFEIALSCQFRICTNNALFAFPESNLGIMPGLGGAVRLPRAVGKSKAIEIMISGRTINSEEAYNLGIVDKIVEGKSHLEEAINFINNTTNGKSKSQIQSIIETVNSSIHKEDQLAMKSENEGFLKLVEKV